MTVSLESYYCISLLYIYIVVEYTASPIEEKAWPFSPKPHHLCGAVGIAIRFGRPGGVHWGDANLVSWGWVKTLVPSEPQNSWDFWMFIPLKMVLIGIDPYPVVFTLEKQERDLLRKTCLFASTVLGDVT